MSFIPGLKILQWLPIPLRIKAKALSTTYKALPDLSSEHHHPPSHLLAFWHHLSLLTNSYLLIIYFPHGLSCFSLNTMGMCGLTLMPLPCPGCSSASVLIFSDLSCANFLPPLSLCSNVPFLTKPSLPYRKSHLALSTFPHILNPLCFVLVVFQGTYHISHIDNLLIIFIMGSALLGLTSMGAGLFVWFFHWFSPSTEKSAWHIVGIQQIYVEQMNKWPCF